MNKIKEAIVCLVFDEPFYGHLVSRMSISKTDSIPTAGVYISDKINLIYNEEWIEKLELFDVVKVLKHECGHILQEHILRAKQIGIQNAELHKRFNIATDVTINIQDLVPTVEKIGGVTVDTLNNMLKEMVDAANKKDGKSRKFKPMRRGEIAEYYYNKINEFAEENSDIISQEGNFGETIDDHSSWDKSEGNIEMQKEVVKQTINETVKACGGIGNIPGNIASIVNDMNKSQVKDRKSVV